MKILFPTALSVFAKQYFQFALEFAHKFNGELIMMHTFPKEESRTSASVDLQNRGRLIMRELKAFVKKNKPEHYKIPISYHVKEGGPIAAILAASNEKEVDLIVMGMKAKTETASAHIGAVAEEIMQTAHCPVLVIPPSAKFDFIEKLVYALDFEFRDLAVIKEMTDWCKVIKANLMCIHVHEKLENKEVVQRNISLLTEIFGNKTPEVKFEVIQGKLKESISKYVNENEVDVLILASHNRSFLQRLFITNTTVKIARTVNIPILILKYA